MCSNVIKSINGSVCTHLVGSDHTVQPTQAFRPIYLIRKKQPKFHRYRILTIAGAVGIRLFARSGVPKNSLIQAVKRPWPPLKSTKLANLIICDPQWIFTGDRHTDFDYK